MSVSTPIYPIFFRLHIQILYFAWYVTICYYDEFSYILFRLYRFWILHTMMTVQISWRHEIFNCLNKNTMVMYWLSIDSTWFLKHMLCRDGWYFDFHSDYSVLLNDLRFLLKLYNIWLCIPYSFSDHFYWYKSHVIPHSDYSRL